LDAFSNQKVSHTQNTQKNPVLKKSFRKKKIQKKRIFSQQYKKRNIMPGEISYPKLDIDFLHPLKEETFWVSSPYGLRFNKKKKKYEMHHGTDFAAIYGTPVYAFADGMIIETSFRKNGFGKSIVIFHGQGISTRYAHLSRILVSYKQKIRKGDLIGLVGATGNTRGKKSGSHLHFELMINKKRYNPLFYI
jgi:murein DD-endopeptidase MepM/ murein hydrolase activator NlpD